LAQVRNAFGAGIDIAAEFPSTHGAGSVARVRSHCRFIKIGAEYVSEYGLKWMSGSTKRQCDRALDQSTGPKLAGKRAKEAFGYLDDS
jgi:hypothetical protein